MLQAMFAAMYRIKLSVKDNEELLFCFELCGMKMINVVWRNGPI